MTDRKIEMIVVDGVRYRPEDAPKKKEAPARKAAPSQKK